MPGLVDGSPWFFVPLNMYSHCPLTTCQPSTDCFWKSKGIWFFPTVSTYWACAVCQTVIRAGDTAVNKISQVPALVVLRLQRQALRGSGGSQHCLSTQCPAPPAPSGPLDPTRQPADTALVIDTGQIGWDRFLLGHLPGPTVDPEEGA